MGNAVQKHFFAYSELIMDTLKKFHQPIFLISASKVNILQGSRLDPICPNLPIHSKTNVSKKSWYTPHLRDTLILIIFHLGGLGSTFAVMCHQSHEWCHSKNIYISSQNFTDFCLNCCCQVQSIVDRGGPKAQSFPKWLLIKYHKQPQPLFCKRGVRKTFYKSH